MTRRVLGRFQVDPTHLHPECFVECTGGHSNEYGVHSHALHHPLPMKSNLEMGHLHPDIRADADIRLLFPAIQASASAPAPAGGYPSAAAGIRAGILGYPPSKGSATDRLEGDPSGRRGTSTSSTGRTPFRSTRYLYLAGWKDFLPAGPSPTL
ncbi:hypothetical protein PGT21_006905 [Puccinia graminis f. sp. tritici]|uniref:Uncharacterized protein n=1 Tax=Puccinia graminis f. sp. tritici TaxID=56615 RepID=A0A5B0MEQ9_PUCGR|nr:hypothetical protein PGT21_006905 [Puccinia graminis f. sp. tritici]